jgi:hypothetical protein
VVPDQAEQWTFLTDVRNDTDILVRQPIHRRRQLIALPGHPFELDARREPHQSKRGRLKPHGPVVKDVDEVIREGEPLLGYLISDRPQAVESMVGQLGLERIAVAQRSEAGRVGVGHGVGCDDGVELERDWRILVPKNLVWLLVVHLVKVTIELQKGTIIVRQDHLEQTHRARTQATNSARWRQSLLYTSMTMHGISRRNTQDTIKYEPPPEFHCHVPTFAAANPYPAMLYMQYSSPALRLVASPTSSYVSPSKPPYQHEEDAIAQPGRPHCVHGTATATAEAQVVYGNSQHLDDLALIVVYRTTGTYEDKMGWSALEVESGLALGHWSMRNDREG